MLLKSPIDTVDLEDSPHFQHYRRIHTERPYLVFLSKVLLVVIGMVHSVGGYWYDGKLFLEFSHRQNRVIRGIEMKIIQF